MTGLQQNYRLLVSTFNDKKHTISKLLKSELKVGYDNLLKDCTNSRIKEIDAK
ncbi:hypothetical protein JHK82_018553 [Glycine max]|nr:hypothetical protein JHK82_018553 [Glycine max]